MWWWFGGGRAAASPDRAAPAPAPPHPLPTGKLNKNPLNNPQVVAWYDNEWGYSQRVVDLAELTAQKWE